MNKLSSAMGAVALLVVGFEAAQARAITTNDVNAGTYYALTPAAARNLNVDLERLTELVQLQDNQKLAFQLLEDGELDLSIYENGVFSSLMADLVK